MIATSLVLAALLAAGAQTTAPPKCESAEHAALDFWVGEWTVVNAKGQPAGRSRVERILDGCVVMENWSNATGPYAGKSFNTYNPADKQWTQHWVDSTGASVIMTGRFEGKSLVYTRDLVRADGKPAKSRMTFFNLGDRRVRQLVEQSVDGGRTWTSQIDLTYTPRG